MVLRLSGFGLELRISGLGVSGCIQGGGSPRGVRQVSDEGFRFRISSCRFQIPSFVLSVSDSGIRDVDFGFRVLSLPGFELSISDSGLRVVGF